MECHTGPEPSWPKACSNMDMVKICLLKDLCALDLTRLLAFPFRTLSSECLLETFVSVLMDTNTYWHMLSFVSFFFVGLKCVWETCLTLDLPGQSNNILESEHSVYVDTCFQLVEQPVDRHPCRQGSLAVVRREERGMVYGMGGSV